jgi:hypothetical protein
MKKTVYLDSTIFSFYFDERLECQHRRKVTIEWWKTQKRFYDCYTSAYVIAELRNPEKVADMAEQLPIVEDNAEIRGIIKIYLSHKLMPADAAGDAAHLAMASYHSLDFLLTWNCTHLANANKVEHMRVINLRLGLMSPEIVTPEQLFEEE